MEFKVYRPNSEQPDELHAVLDPQMLHFVLSHLNSEYDKLDHEIVQHSECDRLSAEGCKVGTGHAGTGNCLTSLQRIHADQMMLLQTLKDAHLVRDNPEAKDAVSFRQAQQDLVKAREVAIRTMEPTSQYTIIENKSSDTGAHHVIPQASIERREVDLQEVQNIQTRLQEEMGTTTPEQSIE
jgi:hypothetical protein